MTDHVKFTDGAKMIIDNQTAQKLVLSSDPAAWELDLNKCTMTHLESGAVVIFKQPPKNRCFLHPDFSITLSCDGDFWLGTFSKFPLAPNAKLLTRMLGDAARIFAAAMVEN